MNALIINVVQLIKFNINQKLTDFTLNCTVFDINLNTYFYYMLIFMTYFAGENYIRIAETLGIVTADY